MSIMTVDGVEGFEIMLVKCFFERGTRKDGEWSTTRNDFLCVCVCTCGEVIMCTASPGSSLQYKLCKKSNI